MDLISIAYLVFFVVVLVCYYLIPKKIQWVWLLISSFFFYMYASPQFVVFLLIATVTTFCSSLIVGNINQHEEKYLAEYKNQLSIDDRKYLRRKNNTKKKVTLISCLVITIGILVFLKYSNFLIETFNVFGSNLPEIEWLILPLGISFYTFQSVGYAIDVYRGDVVPQRNIFKYALFVSFFPQILMGPIGRYNHLAPQLFEEHSFDGKQVVYGLQRILWGFFKKLVIANTIALFVDSVYADVGSHSGFVLACATVGYAIQMYADFTGFVDIAVGTAQTMGIKLAENFRRPYFSRTIPEYWRRWHITLGAWFKDYVFYSLMRTKWAVKFGQKLKKTGHLRLALLIPPAIALIITWSLLGLWHGAEWHYVVFGLFYGVIMILSIAIDPFSKKVRNTLHINPKRIPYQLFQILRTMCIICFGYIIFRAVSMTDAITVMHQMIASPFAESLGLTVSELINVITSCGISRFSGIAMVCGCILCLFISSLEEWKGVDTYHALNSIKLPVRWVILLTLLFATIFFGEFGTTTFIYFQF